MLLTDALELCQLSVESYQAITSVLVLLRFEIVVSLIVRYWFGFVFTTFN